ncbi:hypothetical protein [Ponticoccus litoralis]|uniref:Uncharacterized protein n=1 Tax=Ponticoccus litoralis TaxID=422297 RepID=A0AAW9SAK8_9RHOB
MSSIRDRTIQLIDIGGLEYALGPGELLFLLRHNASRLYLLCVYALLVVTDAPGLLGQVAIPVLLALWLLMLALFLGTFWCILFAIAAAQSRLGLWETPAPLITVPSRFCPAPLPESTSWPP